MLSLDWHKPSFCPNSIWRAHLPCRLTVTSVISALSEFDSGDTVTFIMEALYGNGLIIIALTYLAKSAGIGYDHRLSFAVEKGFGGTQT